MGNRSKKKPPFVDPKLIKKVAQAKAANKFAAIKTWSRRSTIIPAFVGVTFAVHNGKNFIPVTVQSKMVMKKLGAFAPTRTFTGHSGNRKTK
jgi:small subunit ribosomal protein S19